MRSENSVETMGMYLGYEHTCNVDVGICGQGVRRIIFCTNDEKFQPVQKH